MKKLFILFFILIGGVLWATDFGLYLDNFTSVKNNEDNLIKESLRASIWFDLDLGKEINFMTKGGYSFSIDVENEYTGNFNLDTVRLKGEFPILGYNPVFLYFQLGQFTVSDFTSYVLSHSLDGLEFGFGGPFVNMNLFFGTPALILKNNSSIVLSIGDKIDKIDDDVYFAPPRLIGKIEFQFPELFLRQSLTLSTILQYDIRNKDQWIEQGTEGYDSTRGGPFNSQYFGLGLGGGLVSTLFWDSFLYLGIGDTMSFMDNNYSMKPILSFLTGGGLRFYMKELLASKLFLHGIFASGDGDYVDVIEGNRRGDAYAFTPITPTSLGIVFSPILQNITMIEAGYSIKPVDSLQTMLKGILFLRNTTGAISEAGINPESEAIYLGTEVDLIINFRPLSDMGFALSGGVFIPNSGGEEAFDEEQQELDLLARLDVSLSF